VLPFSSLYFVSLIFAHFLGQCKWFIFLPLSFHFHPQLSRHFSLYSSLSSSLSVYIYHLLSTVSPFLPPFPPSIHLPLCLYIFLSVHHSLFFLFCLLSGSSPLFLTESLYSCLSPVLCLCMCLLISISPCNLFGFSPAPMSPVSPPFPSPSLPFSRLFSSTFSPPSFLVPFSLYLLYSHVSPICVSLASTFPFFSVPLPVSLPLCLPLCLHRCLPFFSISYICLSPSAYVFPSA
jgi:hypothetical protein